MLTDQILHRKRKKTVKKSRTKKSPVKKKAVKSATVKSKITPVKSKKSADKIKPVKNKSAVDLLVDAVVEGILEVKGKNIYILDLRKIKNRVCEYYIICNADSKTQVGAIADSVEFIVNKQIGDKPYRTEGSQNAEWILVDYVTAVVHIFQTEIRGFYNIEALWADAEITKLAND